MSSEMEAANNKHRDLMALRLARMCEGGLDECVESAGGNLLGMSVKCDPYEVLLTIRADFPGGRMVCFVGSRDLAAAILKAGSDIRGNKARWRPDKWAEVNRRLADE